MYFKKIFQKKIEILQPLIFSNQKNFYEDFKLITKRTTFQNKISQNIKLFMRILKFEKNKFWKNKKISKKKLSLWFKKFK